MTTLGRSWLRRLLTVTLILAATGVGVVLLSDGQEPAAPGEDALPPAVEALARSKADRAWLAATTRLVDDKGDVRPDAALQAFALTSGREIDGVTVPRDGLTIVTSGSGARRWVMGVYDQLTPAQQAVIDDTASVDPTTSPSGQAVLPFGESAGARFAGRREECSVTMLATAFRLVHEQEAVLQRTAGRSVAMPIVESCDPQLQVTAMSVLAYDPIVDAVAVCRMIFHPRFDDLTEVQQRSTVAHEIFHCLQYDIMGRHADRAPPWLMEGGAAFYGESVAPGVPEAASWWTRWYGGGRLFLPGLDYPAIGFFSGLARGGVPVISTMVEHFDQFAQDPAGARRAGPDRYLDRLEGDLGPFFKDLMTGRAHRPALGAAWDMPGPGSSVVPAPLNLPQYPDGPYQDSGSTLQMGAATR